MSTQAPLLVHLTLIQGILLCVIIVCIFCIRLAMHLKEKYNQSQHRLISQQLISHLQTNTPYHPKKELRYPFYPVLYAVEAFNLRLTGDQWIALKKEVAHIHLLPTARKWAHSRSWIKRNAAARTFTVAPLPEDEAFILQLIDDPIFLVKSPAMKAAVTLELKSGVMKILEHMCLEQGYPHLCYRDIFMQGSSRLFSWIAEIAAETDRLALQLICCELLSSRHIALNPLFLRKAFESSIPELRLGAIKICARNPQKETADILMHSLTDVDENIRAQAVFGIRYLENTTALDPLTTALSDPALSVRLQAAASLKHCGEEGLAILKNQQQEPTRSIAQYALEFL